MSVTVEFSSDEERRLQAEAARRNITVGGLLAELVAALPDPEHPQPRRWLAISAVGASGGRKGRAADADELLAEGFGRD